MEDKLETSTKLQGQAIQNVLDRCHLDYKSVYAEIFPGEKYYELEELPYKKTTWLIQVLNRVDQMEDDKNKEVF
jgi:hypothetical protein